MAPRCVVQTRQRRALSTRSAISTLVAALALLTPAQALVFTGSTGGLANPFLASFAFGSDPNGGTVGSMTVQYTSSSQATVLLEYNDAAWSSVYGAYAGSSLSCADAQQGATNTLTLDGVQGVQTQDFLGVARPFFWFFTVINEPACSPSVDMSYTITLKQADGSQLSYDQLGLPALYGCFWAVFAILTAVHVARHYVLTPRFGPTVGLLYSAALSLFMLHLLFSLILWARMAADGLVDVPIAVLATLLRGLAHLVLLALAALVAGGYGVTTYKLTTTGNLVGCAIWALFAVAYAAASVVRLLGMDAAQPNPDLGNWPAIVLIALFLAFLGWFVLGLRRTILGETRTDKRAVLFRLGLALAYYCLILPAVELAAGVSPVYERYRVRSIVDCVLHLLLFAALQGALWPGVAARAAFRVADGSHALLLQVEGDVLHVFAQGEAEGDGLADGMGPLYATLKLQEHGTFTPPSPPFGPAASAGGRAGGNSASGGGGAATASAPYAPPPQSYLPPQPQPSSSFGQSDGIGLLPAAAAAGAPPLSSGFGAAVGDRQGSLLGLQLLPQAGPASSLLSPGNGAAPRAGAALPSPGSLGAALAAAGQPAGEAVSGSSAPQSPFTPSGSGSAVPSAGQAAGADGALAATAARPAVSSKRGDGAGGSSAAPRTAGAAASGPPASGAAGGARRSARANRPIPVAGGTTVFGGVVVTGGSSGGSATGAAAGGGSGGRGAGDASGLVVGEGMPTGSSLTAASLGTAGDLAFYGSSSRQ